MPNSNKDFWNTVKKCQETVSTWPPWMQNIVITAESASTGKFIRTDKD